MQPRTIGLWPGVVGVFHFSSEMRLCVTCAEKKLSPAEMAYVETGYPNEDDSGKPFDNLYIILSTDENETFDFDAPRVMGRWGDMPRARTCDECDEPLADDGTDELPF